jgi:hypothetical protein
MLQVRSRLNSLTLQHPPHHEEEKQCVLHNRKSHVSIRDYAPYGGEWEGEQVIVCPLPMRQEIHDAMGEHADKKGHRRFIEHSDRARQGSTMTNECIATVTVCNMEWCKSVWSASTRGDCITMAP